MSRWALPFVGCGFVMVSFIAASVVADLSENPAQYFALLDNATISYGSGIDRGKLVENMRRLWMRALRLEPSSTKLFILMSKNSTFPNGVTNETISYVVAGFQPETSVLNMTVIQAQFQFALKYYRLTISPGGFPSPSTSQFVFCDSVWMVYDSVAHKDALVSQLQDDWTTVLRSGWSGSGVRIIPLQIVPKVSVEYGPDPVKVITVIVGESARPVNVDQARLKVRQVLNAMHSSTLFGTPFKWTSDRTTEATTSTIPGNDQINITHSAILALSSVDDLNRGVELMRKLWAFVLRAPWTSVNISVISDVQIHSDGPVIDTRLLHNVSFVTSFQRRNQIIDPNEADKKFQRLLDLTTASFVVDLPMSAVNLSALIMPVSSVGTVWAPVNSFELSNLNGNETLPVDITNPLVWLVCDKVNVSNITGDVVPKTVLPSLLNLWKAVLGDDAAYLVQISANNWVRQGNRTLIILYTAVFISDDDSWDSDALRKRFRELLPSTPTNTSAVFTPVDQVYQTALLETIPSGTRSFIFYDTVNLAYMTNDVPGAAVVALRETWVNVLGPKAWDVMLAVYRTESKSSFSLSGDQGNPVSTLYFRVIFTSNTSDWDTSILKSHFRDIVPTVRNSSLLLSVTSFQPITTMATTAAPTSLLALPLDATTAATQSSGGSVIQDTIIFSYPNETERNLLMAQLRKLWADALGQDVFEVRLNVLTEMVLFSNSSNSTGEATAHRVTYSVVPSTNQKYDVAAAKARFQTLVQNTAAFQHDNFTETNSSEVMTGTHSAALAKAQFPSPTNWTIYTPSGDKLLFVYVIYGRALVTSQIAADQGNEPARLKSAWEEILSPSGKMTFTIFGQTSADGNQTATAVDYAVTLISSSSIIATEQAYAQVWQKLANDSRIQELLFHDRPARLAVFVDSVEFTSTGEILKTLKHIWKDAAAVGLLTRDVNVELYSDNQSSSSDETKNEVMHYLSYVVHVIGKVDTEIPVKSILQDFIKFAVLANATLKFHRDAVVEKSAGTAGMPNVTPVPSSPNLARSLRLRYSSSEDLQSAVASLRLIWASILGLNTSVLRIDLFNGSLPSQDSLSGSLVSYSVLFPLNSSDSSASLSAANDSTNEDLRLVLTNATTDSRPLTANVLGELAQELVHGAFGFMHHTTTLSPSIPEVRSYIIYDDLRLYYQNKSEHDGALVAFQDAWTKVLGDDAMFVRLASYQEFPPYVNDSYGGCQDHAIYYVVVFLSRTRNLDVESKKELFRQFGSNGTIPFVFNFDQVYPASEPDPIVAFAIVDTSNTSAETLRIATDEVQDAVGKLYRLAIGYDARVVEAWNYIDRASTSDIFPTRYQIVLVVTNNTKLTNLSVEQRFRDLLFFTNIAASRTTIREPTASENHPIPVLPGPTLVFTDSVRVGREAADNEASVVDGLKENWRKVLGAQVNSLEIRILRSTEEAQLSNGNGVLLTYEVRGALNHTVLDFGNAQSRVLEAMHLTGSTLFSSTSAPKAANVLFP